MHVLFVMLFLNVVHYDLSYLWVDEQILTSQSFFIFGIRCENFVMVLMILAMDILIEISFTSFVDELTFIFAEIESNTVETHEFKCVDDNGSDITFESDNENVDCGEFFNVIIVFKVDAFDCAPLSPLAALSTDHQHPTVFDSDGTEVESSANNVLKCECDDNKNGNNILCTQTRIHYIIKESLVNESTI